MVGALDGALMLELGRSQRHSALRIWSAVVRARPCASGPEGGAGLLATASSGRADEYKIRSPIVQFASSSSSISAKPPLTNLKAASATINSTTMK